MKEKTKKRLQTINIVLAWVGIVGLIISVTYAVRIYLGNIFAIILLFIILLSLLKISDKYFHK